MGDPPCGFDVYRGRLYVSSLSARGEIDVWIGDRLVRSGRSIVAGETEVFRLKRRHTAADFTVAIVATGRKHNDEHVSWCEPA